MLKIDLDVDRLDKWSMMYLCWKAYFRGAYYHLTEHGVHIILPNVRETPLLRLMYGDDIIRLEMDMERERKGFSEACNILFVAKNGKKVKVTKKIDEVIEWIEGLKT